MSTLIRRGLGTIALTLPLSACYTVEHFSGDQSLYDGLYFGSRTAIPESPGLHDEQWRHDAIYGTVPWDPAQIQFSGRRLGQVGKELRPMNVVVTSEMTVVQGLVNLAVAFVPFGNLVFQTRNVEVDGWKRG
ncbi:MAG: hypothetical protein AAF726_01240 [Planctomycetota bacterium]